MTRKAKETSTSEPVDATDIMNIGLEGLRDHVKLVAKQVIGDPDAAASLAHLLSKVAVVNAEQRKAEAAARNADAELTPQQMLERFRRMSSSERQQFLRAAQHADADQGRSGLA